MWKEQGKKILAWITLGIVILLQISFHIIESLFHKVLSILTFLPNMTLEIITHFDNTFCKQKRPLSFLRPSEKVTRIKRSLINTIVCEKLFRSRFFLSYYFPFIIRERGDTYGQYKTNC